MACSLRKYVHIAQTEDTHPDVAMKVPVSAKLHVPLVSQPKSKPAILTPPKCTLPELLFPLAAGEEGAVTVTVTVNPLARHADDEDAAAVVAEADGVTSVREPAVDIQLAPLG